MIIPQNPPKHATELEVRTLGLSQNIYLSNATRDYMHVMPCRRLGWVIADVIADIGLVALAIFELQIFLGDIPHIIKTFGDLFQTLQSAIHLLSLGHTLISRPIEAAREIIQWFKTEGIAIPPKQTVNVMNANVVETFLQPSGLAGLLNAPTITLILMSGDGKHVTTWTSGPDMSWVVRNQGVYRVKYGTLWVPEPDYKAIKPDHIEEGEEVEQQRRSDDSDDITIVDGIEIPWVVKWQ